MVVEAVVAVVAMDGGGVGVGVGGGGVICALELAVAQMYTQSTGSIIFGREKKTVNFKERCAGSPF